MLFRCISAKEIIGKRNTEPEYNCPELTPCKALLYFYRYRPGTRHTVELGLTMPSEGRIARWKSIAGAVQILGASCDKMFHRIRPERVSTIRV